MKQSCKFNRHKGRTAVAKGLHATCATQEKQSTVAKNSTEFSFSDKEDDDDDDEIQTCYDYTTGEEGTKEGLRGPFRNLL